MKVMKYSKVIVARLYTLAVILAQDEASGPRVPKNPRCHSLSFISA